jgi:type IV pilus assembly protein PilE
MKRKKLQGVTLIELLMVVVIIGILASLAYPTYQNHLYKIRRSEGQQKLLLLALDLEDFYGQHHTYENYQSHLKSDYYALAATNLSSKSYELSATPISHQAQKNDSCGTLTLSSLQVMGPREECWG